MSMRNTRSPKIRDERHDLLDTTHTSSEKTGMNWSWKQDTLDVVTHTGTSALYLSELLQFDL